jgi:hypothetical protein
VPPTLPGSFIVQPSNGNYPFLGPALWGNAPWNRGDWISAIVLTPYTRADGTLGYTWVEYFYGSKIGFGVF